MEDYRIDFEGNLLPWIGRTSKLIDHCIAEQFSSKGIELTKVQMLLLKSLKESNGIPQHNLAYLTNRDKASLARLLNTMEKKTLVARIPSDMDHRINLIYITKNGESLFKRAWPVMKDTVDLIQKNIIDSEIKSVINVFRKILANLNAEEFSEIQKLQTEKDQHHLNNK